MTILRDASQLAPRGSSGRGPCLWLEAEGEIPRAHRPHGEERARSACVSNHGHEKIHGLLRGGDIGFQTFAGTRPRPLPRDRRTASKASALGNAANSRARRPRALLGRQRESSFHRQKLRQSAHHVSTRRRVRISLSRADALTRLVGDVICPDNDIAMQYPKPARRKWRAACTDSSSRIRRLVQAVARSRLAARMSDHGSCSFD
jgi:hypothetical protein